MTQVPSSFRTCTKYGIILKASLNQSSANTAAKAPSQLSGDALFRRFKFLLLNVRHHCFASAEAKILSSVITLPDILLQTKFRSSTLFKILMNSYDFIRRVCLSSFDNSRKGIVHSCSPPLNLRIFMCFHPSACRPAHTWTARIFSVLNGLG